MDVLLAVVLLALGALAGAYALLSSRRSLALALLALAPLLAVLPLVVRAPSAATESPSTAATGSAPGAPAASASTGATAPAPAPAPAPTSAARPAAVAGSSFETVRAQAEAFAAQKDFARAREAYAALVRERPDDADLWADYADACAGAAGGDLEAGATAMDRALALAPHHPKALWLKASLELARHHYERAESLWQELLGELPPGSDDARVVEANLKEAAALRGGARSP
jgi:tetratricopeptide (TPR) repeat protein